MCQTVSKKIFKYTQKETINCTRETVNCATRRIKTSVQEKWKKDQEHEFLSWFTLPQGLRPVFCKLAKISTRKDLQDQHQTIQHLHLASTPCS